METETLFKRVHELTGKFPNLNEKEIRALRLLANNLSVECSDAIYDMEMARLKLHKYLRDIRIEYGELLKDMADKLGMGSAELSAIEHGRKPTPEGFLEKVQSIYNI